MSKTEKYHSQMKVHNFILINKDKLYILMEERKFHES